MEKSSSATLECEDIKTRLQNDDEDSIPLADDDVSASVLGPIYLLNRLCFVFISFIGELYWPSRKFNFFFGNQRNFLTPRPIQS